MTSHKNILRHSYLVFLLLIVTPALANDPKSSIVFIPSIALTTKNVEFTREDALRIAGLGTWQIKEVLEFSALDADLSVTTIVNNLYVKANLEVPLSENSAEIDSTANFILPGGNSGVAQDNVSDLDIDRENVNLTVGYALPAGFSVFGGYRVMQTHYESRSSANASELTFSSVQQNFTTYNERGLFVGAGYGYSLDRFGDLTISVAYADLELTTQTSITTTQLGKLNDAAAINLVPKITGDLTGLSYSLKWSKRFAEFWALYANYKIHEYDLDSDAGVAQISASTDQLVELDLLGSTEITEKISAYTIGLNYLF